MMIKSLITTGVLLTVLVSCGPNKHVNSWDRESSALDPVGITSKKLAAKKAAEAAAFKPGEQITFRNAKLMAFDQNPEQSYSSTSRLVDAGAGAKVISCGELFACVEFADGTTGYVNVSDIVNPMESMPAYPVDAFGLPLPISTPDGASPTPPTLPPVGVPSNVPLPKSSLEQ